MSIKLQRVHYMPQQLAPRVLYVSEEFSTAAHLCACGCGSKIRTPLGPKEWQIKDAGRGPCLYPSIGNWQHACKSHYWIHHGEVIWAEQWSPEQINSGRQYEEARRRAYYDTPIPSSGSLLQDIWNWLKMIFQQK